MPKPCYLIGFTGHRIGYDEAVIRTALKAALVDLQKRAFQAGGEVGIHTSIAEGTDTLCVEVARDLGMPVHLVLPLPEEEFEKDFSSPQAWERSRRQIELAIQYPARDSVRFISDEKPRPECYLAQGLQMVETVDVLLTVWDGESARGVGGTEQIIAHAKRKGIPVLIIDSQTSRLRAEGDMASLFTQETQPPMPTNSLAPDADALGAHLSAAFLELKRQEEEPGEKKPREDFDMDDAPEGAVLLPFDTLKRALETLAVILGGSYLDADTKARAHQKSHRRLAKWAILTGCSAVALAIIQLGMQAVIKSWATVPLVLEVVAVVAGGVAVFTGQRAKHDHEWLIRRFYAERLRMLKFRSLSKRELWCGDFDKWEAWVIAKRDRILQVKTREHLEDHLVHGPVELEEDTPSQCVASASAVLAVSRYYRWKRLEFQKNYFENRQETLAKAAGPLRKLGLPLFYASIFAVFVHVIADVYSHSTAAHSETVASAHASEGVVAPSENNTQHGRSAHAENKEESGRAVAIFSLVIATLIPLVSLSVRAWMGAFEPIRCSAHFEAKACEMADAIAKLTATEHDLTKTIHHIASLEHGLDQEHRVWLRLMIETEWFI